MFEEKTVGPTFLIILLIFSVAGCVGGSSFDSPEATIHNYIRGYNTENADLVYKSRSERWQNLTKKGNIKERLFRLGEMEDVKMSVEKISNLNISRDRATAEVKLMVSATPLRVNERMGKPVTINVSLVKENDKWKISKFPIGSAVASASWKMKKDYKNITEE